MKKYEIPSLTIIGAEVSNHIAGNIISYEGIDLPEDELEGTE